MDARINVPHRAFNRPVRYKGKPVIVPRIHHQNYTATGSEVLGAGSNDSCLPTGDGAVMSHSTPLESRSLAIEDLSGPHHSPRGGVGLASASAAYSLGTIYITSHAVFMAIRQVVA